MSSVDGLVISDALHLRDDTVHAAVADRLILQGGGNLLQEDRAIAGRERLGRAQNGVHLCIGELQNLPVRIGGRGVGLCQARTPGHSKQIFGVN